MSSRNHLLASIKQCGSARDLWRARAIHQEAILDGYGDDRLVLNSLVSMYGRSGSLDEAIGVFESIDHKNRDVVSWNCLMLGYAEARDAKSCLHLLERMQKDGIRPNARSFVAGIKACSIAGGFNREEGKDVSLEALEIGMDFHCQAWKNGVGGDIFVVTTLIDMYVKCGSLVDARRVFDGACNHNTVLWNALLLGYVENGEEEMALELFSYMDQEGCDPDARTFVAMIKACGSLATKEGKTFDPGGNKISYNEGNLEFYQEGDGQIKSMEEVSLYESGKLRCNEGKLEFYHGCREEDGRYIKSKEQAPRYKIFCLEKVL